MLETNKYVYLGKFQNEVPCPINGSNKRKRFLDLKPKFATIPNGSWSCQTNGRRPISQPKPLGPAL